MHRLSHPEDVRDMPEPVRRAVVAALLRLREEPELGKPLRPLQPHQRHRGDLSGLRALTVPGTYDDEVRIVYRVEPGREVEVIAIAPRQGSACYRLAAERLYPAPEQRRVRPYGRRRRQEA